MFKTKRARKDQSGQEELGEVQTANTDENGNFGWTASASSAADVLRSKVPHALTPKRRQTEPPDGETIRQQFEAVRRYAAEPRPAFVPEPRRTATEEPSRLLIGRDITFKGEIGQCRTLVVEGNVGANVKCETLQVHEEGNFDGDIEAETAEVCGRVEGRIKIRGRLTIRTAGLVSGDVTYGELDIAAGGRLAGKIAHVPAPEHPTKAEPTDAHGEKPAAPTDTAATVDKVRTALPVPSDLEPPVNPFDPVGQGNGKHSDATDDSGAATPESDPIPLAVGTAGVRT